MALNVKSARRMPSKVELGRPLSTTMAAPMLRHRNWRAEAGEAVDGRYVMGFRLPAWQRGLVWSTRQKVSFIESAWRGISLGTYSYNDAPLGSPFDNLLIDGQQRMNAIECYLGDEFAVLGWHWSEVTEVDRRVWEMSTVFGCYVTETEDERYLREYYDLLNFGGTPHRSDERAADA